MKRANILRVNNEELKVLKNLLGLKGSNDEMCLKLKEDYELLYMILGDTAKESKIFGIDGEVTTIKNSRLHQTFAFGAGNAFAGTFLSAILKGKSQAEAHELANNVAIELCKQLEGVY